MRNRSTLEERWQWQNMTRGRERGEKGRESINIAQKTCIILLLKTQQSSKSESQNVLIKWTRQVNPATENNNLF